MVAAAEVLSRPEITLRSTLQPPVVPAVTGYEFKPEQLAEIASNMTSNTKQVTAPDILPAREVLTDGHILRRDNMLAGEHVSAREVNGNIELRGLEMPAQAVTNTAHQAVLNTVSNMHAAPVHGTGNIVPASEQILLPPQLESMNLTRNADSTEWGNGLSDRVNWMINQKQNSATIRLDPPALGKLDVQIKIVDDTTTITIQTQTGQTRDLIEAASTRLRDFLQESGYQNVNVDVSQRQDQQQARAQTAANTNPEQDDAGDQELGSDQQQDASYFSGDGLVDTFA
jgi:flagellar hook-length control protein FliK